MSLQVVFVLCSIVGTPVRPKSKGWSTAMHAIPETLQIVPQEPARDADLGVVMPAYNEGTWVLRAVEALTVAAERAEWSPQITVVDDGTTDPASLRALDEATLIPSVRVLRQSNAGRFAARSRGLQETETEYVLLLDARVEVAPDSLRHIREGVQRGSLIWNFDVTPASQSWGALFWSGITKVWWRDYFRNRTPVSFGIESFDRYPKGTGAFFAPTRVLRAAMEEFASHFGDSALASDDTRLLRNVARLQTINLSPRVACRHHLKPGTGSWVRQCYYRGTTFVDGYLADAALARALLGGAGLAVAAASRVAVRAPRSAGVLALASCVVAGAVTRWSGGSSREAVAVGTLSPAFGVFFGAGVVRGLRLAMGSRG